MINTTILMRNGKAEIILRKNNATVKRIVKCSGLPVFGIIIAAIQLFVKQITERSRPFPTK